MVGEVVGSRLGKGKDVPVVYIGGSGTCQDFGKSAKRLSKP
jgi:hypothetical protein